MKPLNITVHIPSKSDKIPSRCSLTEISDIVSECRSSEREPGRRPLRKRSCRRKKLLRVCAAGRGRAAGVSCAPGRAGNGLLCCTGPHLCLQPRPEGDVESGGRDGRWAGPRNTWENAPQSHFSSLRYLLPAHPQLLSVPQ